MVYSNIGLKVLFLLASSQVASSLLHAPLIYLEMVSDRLTEGEPIKIFCVAPRAHVGAYFYLFMVGQTQPVQMLTAPETQHQVTFLLENATTINTGLYRCQYGLLNRSQLQPSDFSDTVEITVDAFGLSTFPPTFISAFSLSAFAPTGPPMSDCQDPSRVLLIALIVTGVLLLLMTLAMAVLATGCFKERRQKKKELDSCWAEGRGCTTVTSAKRQDPTTLPNYKQDQMRMELSLDNCTFTVSPKTDQQAAESRDAQISSARGSRLAPGSYLEQPDFFTFRAPK